MQHSHDTIITEDVAIAGKILLQGGIVIFPTETVYGIGAISTKPEACKRIYEIKNRPSDNPLIAHFSSIEEIEKYAKIGIQSELLLKNFTPGPLTLILDSKITSFEDSIFTSGLETIACRIPAHTSVRRLLEYVGLPISAPSANISGKPSITREKDAIAVFSGKVDCILKGEEPIVGLESTVVDARKLPIQLLRAGSLDPQKMENLLNLRFIRPTSDSSLSPGNRYKHYAPNAKLTIIEENPSLEILNLQKDEKIAWIGFSKWDKAFFQIVVQSNQEYAYRLYAFLNECDLQAVDQIYCQVPQKDSLQEAIANRLHKASDPR
jgi:L-threonylcarbamoyladenylate synthase